MYVRAVTIAILLLAGCGDDSVPATPDSGQKDAPIGSDGPSPGDCDPVAQNCAADQRCTLNHGTSTDPTNKTFCESGLGVANPFEGCAPTQTSDNCVRGSVCLNTGSVRTCRQFCNSDSDCSNNNICGINIGMTIGPLHACAQRCSVLAQDCTTDGESCYLGLNVTGQATQQCSNTGTVPENGQCMTANDCLDTPGGVPLICISSPGSDGGSTYYCRRACDLSNPMCPAGTMCTTAGTGQGNLGYCRLP